MIVYIVCYACYSDWNIEGVFFDRDKAYAYAAKENDQYNTHCYHVYECEPSDDDFEFSGDLKPRYKVEVEAKRVKSVNKDETGVIFEIVWKSTYPTFEYKEPEIDKYRNPWHIYIYSDINDSDDKILKIAQDHYYQWRAEHELENIPEEHVLRVAEVNSVNEPLKIIQFHDLSKE